MDALVVLRDLAANADGVLMQVFTPVTSEQAAWRLPGSTANTIGATFFHVYESEDGIIHGLLGRPTVFERGGWSKRLGYGAGTVWAFEGRQDPAVLLEYARQVSAGTTDYLSRITVEQLEQPIETRRGPRPLVTRLGVYLVSHKFQHMGEISALLGCQGVKGLPF